VRKRSYLIGVKAAPPNVNTHVAAIGPTEARKRLNERRDASLPKAIVFVEPLEHSDTPHALRLLRVPRQWPSHRAAKARNEFAPSHLQSSSFKIGVEK
jgi:hypothetical protein